MGKQLNTELMFVCLYLKEDKTYPFRILYVSRLIEHGETINNELGTAPYKTIFAVFIRAPTY